MTTQPTNILGWGGFPHTTENEEWHWGYITWFSVLHALALIGVAFAVALGLYWQTAAYAILHFFAGQFATSCCAHRDYAHGTALPTSTVRAIFTIVQAGVMQAAAKVWAGWHRIHHRYTDSPVLDPHSIQRGVWHAHMKWVCLKTVWRMDRAIATAMKNVNPEAARVLHWQRRNFHLLSVSVGVVIPTLAPLLWVWGDWRWWPLAQGFFIGVAVRLTVQYHLTWVINSIAHSGNWKVPFGKPIRGSGSAVNPYLIPPRPWTPLRLAVSIPVGLFTMALALLTVGEMYHANHHVAEDDYRLGRRWYDIDPGKWLLWTLWQVGLIKVLKKVSNEEFQRRQERLAAQHDMS